MQMKVDACVHHWLIAIANGPVSIGTCKLCKTVREFKNSTYVGMHQFTLEKDEEASLAGEEKKKNWNYYNR